MIRTTIVSSMLLSGIFLSSSATKANGEKKGSIAICPAGFSGPLISKDTISSPDIGLVSEVEVGQNVISTMQGAILNKFLVLKNDIQFSGQYFKQFTVSIPSGSYAPSFDKYGWGYYIKDSDFHYGNGSPRQGVSKPEISLFTS